MARCKCKICGTQLDSKTAYKVTDKNGKNKYFCSASEFEAEEARKQKAAEDKDKVYRLICDIFGEEEILNTALWKEKIIWNKAFSDEIIAKYLAENKDYLTSAVSKLSSTEYAKIRYISAILKNNLRDFKPKVEVVETPRVVVEEYYETKYKSKTRMALEDFEEDDDDE